MANLITNHDPFHVHKILGLSVLLHFIYRFYLVATTGGAFSYPKEPTYISICGVLLHGVLSWSSLLLPLPTKRNFLKPMIWPEFRYHSILFATRHVLSTIFTLANCWPSSSSSNNDNQVVLNCISRGTIIIGTVKLASYITSKHGNKTHRTTNTMPYPNNVSSIQETNIKRMYTAAQFGATITCFMNDPTMQFVPLLGIQMAPLLMTLVRKGRISTTTYHRVYSISLSLGYIVIFMRLLLLLDTGERSEEEVGVVNNNTIRTLILFSLPFKKSRKYVSATTFWSITIIFATIVYPLLVMDRDMETKKKMLDFEKYISINTIKYVIWMAMVRTLFNQVIAYAPLFVAPEQTRSTKTTAAESSSTSVLTKEDDHNNLEPLPTLQKSSTDTSLDSLFAQAASR